jgi:hypothetical protein
LLRGHFFTALTSNRNVPARWYGRGAAIGGSTTIVLPSFEDILLDGSNRLLYRGHRKPV